MVIIKFSKYKADERDLRVDTPIKAVIQRGDEVEIEFDGVPSNKELFEIAKKLGLYKIEIAPRRLIRNRPEPKKVIIRRKITSR